MICITMTARERFHELVTHHQAVPVVRKVLTDGETMLPTYHKLATDRPDTFLPESFDMGQLRSRRSFIGCSSRAVLTVDDTGKATWVDDTPSGASEGGNPLGALWRMLELLCTEPPLADDASAPKSISDFAGYFGHGIVRYVEPYLPNTTDNNLQIPELIQLLVENLTAFDCHEGTLRLISNVVNWDGSDERIDQAYDTARDRVGAMVERSSESSDLCPVEINFPEPVIRRQRAAEGHMDRVECCRDHTRTGGTFQIALSQWFEMDTQASVFDTYRILRVLNPSPYMLLVNAPTKDFPDTAFQIAGSPLESLVAVQGGEIITNPVTDTRLCGVTVEQDNTLETDLLAGEKENSEHLMLIDFGHNDLRRACRPGNAAVYDFHHTERCSRVIYLVSTVIGELSSDATAVSASAATFPAGILSGAPKPSVLSIVDKFEDTCQGAYGGTVGYFDFRGDTG